MSNNLGSGKQDGIASTLSSVDQLNIMYRVVLFVFFVFLTTVDAVSDATGRLSNAYNGAENVVVDAERYPFIVSVTLNNKHICGGFIYNSRFIVTAASCVYQKTSSQIQVTVGELSLVLPDPGELKLQVQSITVHEAYDNTTRFNDIAMLEMSQVMEFGPNVNYIPFTEVSGSLAIITGWGAFDETKMMSIKLREARVNSPTNCDVFSTDVFDQNTMFCWGRSEYDSGVRPCQYDEGSPLFYPTSVTTFYAMGIVSKNLGCGDSQIFETIYTRLMAYNDWMLRVGGPQHVNCDGFPVNSGCTGELAERASFVNTKNLPTSFQRKFQKSLKS